MGFWGLLLDLLATKTVKTTQKGVWRRRFAVGFSGHDRVIAYDHGQNSHFRASTSMIQVLWAQQASSSNFKYFIFEKTEIYFGTQKSRFQAKRSWLQLIKWNLWPQKVPIKSMPPLYTHYKFVYCYCGLLGITFGPLGDQNCEDNAKWRLTTEVFCRVFWPRIVS